MKCSRCNTEMVAGIALDDGWTYGCLGARYEVFNDDTIKIIDYLKCPSCGHSDTGFDRNGKPYSEGKINT